MRWPSTRGWRSRAPITASPLPLGCEAAPQTRPNPGPPLASRARALSQGSWGASMRGGGIDHPMVRCVCENGGRHGGGGGGGSHRRGRRPVKSLRFAERAQPLKRARDGVVCQMERVIKAPKGVRIALYSSMACALLRSGDGPFRRVPRAIPRARVRPDPHSALPL